MCFSFCHMRMFMKPYRIKRRASLLRRKREVFPLFNRMSHTNPSAVYGPTCFLKARKKKASRKGRRTPGNRHQRLNKPRDYLITAKFMDFHAASVPIKGLCCCCFFSLSQEKGHEKNRGGERENHVMHKGGHRNVQERAGRGRRKDAGKNGEVVFDQIQRT